MPPSDSRFGDRLADLVASIGGSWYFIIGFAVLMTTWTSANYFVLPSHLRFDPPPFILLNLFLSTLAAVQAPAILMSHNRQADRDRETARRTERLIRDLHRKIDSLAAPEVSEIDEFSA